MGESVLAAVAGPLIGGLFGDDGGGSAPAAANPADYETRLQKLMSDPVALSLMNNLRQSIESQKTNLAGQKAAYTNRISKGGGKTIPVSGGAAQASNKGGASGSIPGSIPLTANKKYQTNPDGTIKTLADGTPLYEGDTPKPPAPLRSNDISNPNYDPQLSTTKPNLNQFGNEVGTKSMSATPQTGTTKTSVAPTTPTVPTSTTGTPVTGTTDKATDVLTAIKDAILSAATPTDPGVQSFQDTLNAAFPDTTTDWMAPNASWDYGDTLGVGTDPLELKVKEQLAGNLDNNPLLNEIIGLKAKMSQTVSDPNSVMAANPYLQKLENQAVDIRKLSGEDLKNYLYNSGADPMLREAKKATQARGASNATRGMFNSSVTDDQTQAADEALQANLGNLGQQAGAQGLQFDQSNIMNASNIYNNLANLFGQTREDVQGNINNQLGLIGAQDAMKRQDQGDVMNFLKNQDEKELLNNNMKYNEFIRRLQESTNAQNQALAAVTGQQPVQMTAMNQANQNAMANWNQNNATAQANNNLIGNVIGSFTKPSGQRNNTAAIPASITNAYSTNPAVTAANAFTFGGANTGSTWKPLSTRPA